MPNINLCGVASEEYDRLAREAVRKYYDQLEPAEQDLFSKIYGEGVDAIPKNKIRWAFIQCYTTVKKREQ